MSAPRPIPIENLFRRPDARQTQEADLTALEASIAEVGLLNPLTVRATSDDTFEIIAGSHRFAVCDGLGHREILCHVVEMDDLRAELAMIDENICRAQLTGVLLDKQMFRRKEIYEELHPETKAHVAGAHASNAAQGNASAKLAPAFSAATATVTGRSERSIQRSAERGEKIAPEAASLIQGTRLDTGSYANSIKDLPAGEQVAKVRNDLAEPKRATPPPAPAPKPVPAGPSDFERFIELVNEIETFRVRDLIASAGRQRSTLGQRANGLAEFASAIIEGVG